MRPTSSASATANYRAANFSFITLKMGMALLAALLIGCAGKAKFQSPPAIAAPPSQQMAESTHAAGNTLSQWRDRTATMSHASAFPPAAEDGAMICDPVQHRVILFGGKDDANYLNNEIWAFDLAANLWQKLTPEGDAPLACEDHVSIYDPIGYRMIIHGGEYDGPTLNQTWAFDLKTLRWRNLTLQGGAPAREDHTAIYDSRGKRMVIFGGRNHTSTDDYVNIYEIWAFDLDPASPTFEKWQNLTVEDKHPLGRTDHVAVYDSTKNRMLIYGGWDKEKKEYLSDTWAFYFAAPPETAGNWVQIKTKKSHPPKRRHAVGVYNSARNWFIVCSGFGDEGYLNDVWAFDLAADVWLNLTPGPQPRFDLQAVYDPQSRHLILYGGDAHMQSKFHDLWELLIQPDLPLDLLLKEAGARTGAATK